MRAVRPLVSAGAGALTLTLALAGGASAAPFGRPWVVSQAPVAVPGWAGYYSNDVAGSAATIVVVPRIDCASNPPGAFEGQAAGIQTLNNYNGSVATGNVGADAVVRTYCNGRTPTYDTAFWLPTPSDNGIEYVPSSVPARPGDVIQFSVTVSASNSVASIRNLTNWRFDSVTGLGVTDAGPDIGITALGVPTESADTIGAPNGASTVPPPAPSTPIAFAFSQANGQPLSALAGLAAEAWTDSADSATVYASPTSLYLGGFFVVNVNS